LRVLSSSARRRREEEVRAVAAAVEDEKSGEGAAGREILGDQIDPSERPRAPRRLDVVVVIIIVVVIVIPVILRYCIASRYSIVLYCYCIASRMATVQLLLVHTRSRHTCEAECKRGPRR